MADKFITELDAITLLEDTDIMVVEDNPSGTAETVYMTVADVMANILKRINYTITRSVSSNNLTVAVKDSDGNDATSAKPLTFNINGTLRKLSAALSLTVNAGANAFNLGGTELLGTAQELFVYVGWRAASSAVFMMLSRMPHCREYADFSSTATSERYGVYSGSAPASTDKVANIGRVTVSNSGTASFNWSVPAADFVYSRPLYETSWMNWTPQYSTSGSLTFTSTSTTFAKYRLMGSAISGLKVEWQLQGAGTLGGSASTDIYATVPFEASQSANSPVCGTSNTAAVAGRMFITAGTPDKLTFQKYDTSNYATSGSNTIKGLGLYEA